jgi:hypothetical protein
MVRGRMRCEKGGGPGGFRMGIPLQGRLDGIAVDGLHRWADGAVSPHIHKKNQGQQNQANGFCVFHSWYHFLPPESRWSGR